MSRSRIAALAAFCLLVLATMPGGAEAQSAGSPLPLLQIDRAKPAVHAAARTARTKSTDKAAHRHAATHIGKRAHAKTRVADAGHDLPAPLAALPQTTPQNDSRNIWPASAAAVAGNVAAPSGSPAPGGVTPAAPAAAPVITEPVVDTDPKGILNSGHAVPAAMSNSVKPADSAPKPQPTGGQPPAPPPSPPIKTAAAAPATPKPAARAMLVTPNMSNPVGSASWIAQILAALLGAIAAGVLAWFLIQPAPERSFS